MIPAMVKGRVPMPPVSGRAYAASLINSILFALSGPSVIEASLPSFVSLSPILYLTIYPDEDFSSSETVHVAPFGKPLIVML